MAGAGRPNAIGHCHKKHFVKEFTPLAASVSVCRVCVCAVGPFLCIVEQKVLHLSAAETRLLEHNAQKETNCI